MIFGSFYMTAEITKELNPPFLEENTRLIVIEFILKSKIKKRQRCQIMNNDEMWNAVKECDASCDGKFFYGVKTTGIYCRPSCKSKLHCLKQGSEGQQLWKSCRLM